MRVNPTRAQYQVAGEQPSGLGSWVWVHQSGTLQGFLLVGPINHLPMVKQMNLSIWVLNPNMTCKTLMQIGSCYFWVKDLGYFHIRIATLPERLSAPGFGKVAGGPGPDRPTPGWSAFSSSAVVWGWSSPWDLWWLFLGALEYVGVSSLKIKCIYGLGHFQSCH